MFLKIYSLMLRIPGYFDLVQSVVMGVRYDNSSILALEFGNVKYLVYFWRVNVNNFGR